VDVGTLWNGSGLKTESPGTEYVAGDFLIGQGKQVTHLALIRHCHSVSAGERYIGTTDTPLTERGRAQAQHVCRRLRAWSCDAIRASPSLRVRETLQMATHAWEPEVVTDADLREIDFGRWEGLRFEDILKQDPERVAEWTVNRMDFAFPEGERLSDFWDRITRVGRVLQTYPQARVAVVAHGGVIRSLLCHFLGLAPERNRMFQIDLGSMTFLTFHAGVAVLAGLNDGGHLTEQARGGVDGA